MLASELVTHVVLLVLERSMLIKQLYAKPKSCPNHEGEQKMVSVAMQSAPASSWHANIFSITNLYPDDLMICTFYVPCNLSLLRDSK